MNKAKKELSPITILGEIIDPDNQPVLYHKARINKEEFEKQLKSIADKWHGGNVRAAILALESDLQHG